MTSPVGMTILSCLQEVQRFGAPSPPRRRVPHISLVFREMWDTAGLPLKPLTGPTIPHGCPTFAPAYVGRKRWAKPHHSLPFRTLPQSIADNPPATTHLPGETQVSKSRPGPPTQSCRLQHPAKVHGSKVHKNERKSLPSSNSEVLQYQFPHCKRFSYQIPNCHYKTLTNGTPGAC
jgi:hypothetical protein